MKISILMLLILILAGCVPKVESEASKGNISSSAPYLWASTALPRQLKISDSFSEAEIINITSMSSAWETAVEDKKKLFEHGIDKAAEVSSPTLSLDDLGKDGVNGIYKITKWPTILPGSALAVTQLFASRHNIGKANEYLRIEHADILVNEHLYNFRTNNTFVSNTFDFRTVMLHEMGHFLGLNHKYGDTVMIPSIGDGSIARAPTNIDRADLAEKYGIVLGTGSAKAIMAGNRPIYSPDTDGLGEKVKILIELMAEGECIHKENGAIVERHPANVN